MNDLNDEKKAERMTVLIMAGGTGGHVFPALAVAHQLQQQGVSIQWLGTRRGIESQLVTREDIPITYISVSGVRGKSMIKRLLAPVKVFSAVVQSMAVIVRTKPDCVLGMGGFASGPGGVAAWLLRKPLLIHEQNAIAGVTNRLLFRLAGRVMAAFPSAFGDPAPAKVRCIGNPVRADIVELDPPESRLDGREGPLRILVLGGSLGAQVLNQILPETLAMFPAEQRPQIWHQTGQQNCEATLEHYQKVKVEARVEAFINSMNEAYEWADLIVCRAGALTVSEISCVGLPAVFVPYPYAVDDHQTENARYLESAGAAVILPQRELTAHKLFQLLTETFDSRSKLLAMARKARALAQFNAAEQAADYCLEACYA